jgi:hypothetical protein
MVPDSLIPDEPSMANAVERMLLAGQQLVVDRLDLMLLEGREGLIRVLPAGVAAGFAMAAFFCGWLCVNASLAVFFEGTAPLSGILAALAAVNVGVGILAVAAARQLVASKGNREAGSAQRVKGGA